MSRFRTMVVRWMRATPTHLFIIAISVVIAYVRLLHPDFHASWDLVTVHTFGLRYASLVWHTFGTFPLWDPFHYVGFPFVGDPQPAVWYPINTLMILVGEVTQRHVQFQLVLHYIIAGFSMYAFGRYLFSRRAVALVVGILYPLTGAFVAHASHVGMVNTAAWFPLLLLCGARGIRERRWSWVVSAGVIAGLMLLAGHAQTALLLFSAYAVWILVLSVTESSGRFQWMRGIAQLLIAIMIGIGISAIQLAPTARFAFETTRETTNFDWAMTESFVPSQLLTVLVPNFFGDVTADPYWGPKWGSQHYAYLGILPLLLIGLSFLKRKTTMEKFFWGLAVISLLFMIGRFSFVQPLFYLFAPLFNHFRAAANSIFLFHTSLVILAGFGLQAVLERDPQMISSWSRAGRFSKVLSIVLLILLIGVEVVAFLSRSQWKNPEATQALDNIGSGIVLLFGFGIASLVLLSSFFRKRISQVRFLVFTVLILVLDLFTFTLNHQHVAQTGPIAKTQRPPWGIEFIQSQAEDHWYRVHALQQDDILSPEFIYQTSGYNPLITERYARMLHVASQDEERFNRVMSAWGVEYLLGEENLPTTSWEQVTDFWYRNPNFRGRVWPVSTVVAIPEGETLAVVEQRVGRTNLDQTAVVEGFSETKKFKTDVSVGEVEDTINAVRFTVEAIDPAFLVMSDAMDGAWKLWIDGVESRLYWTDLMLRGFEVPEGSHEVVMKFEPVTATWPRVLSIATSIGAIAGWGVLRLFERRKLRSGL